MNEDFDCSNSTLKIEQLTIQETQINEYNEIQNNEYEKDLQKQHRPILLVVFDSISNWLRR